MYYFSKLLRNDKKLMACIFETIGQLNISKEDLVYIQLDMIPVIHHTPPDVLPALVRFLIKIDDRSVAEKVSSYFIFLQKITYIKLNMCK